MQTIAKLKETIKGIIQSGNPCHDKSSGKFCPSSGHAGFNYTRRKMAQAGKGLGIGKYPDIMIPFVDKQGRHGFKPINKYDKKLVTLAKQCKNKIEFRHKIFHARKYKGLVDKTLLSIDGAWTIAHGDFK